LNNDIDYDTYDHSVLTITDATAIGKDVHLTLDGLGDPVPNPLPAGGWVRVKSNGEFSWKFPYGFNGSVDFTYDITDGSGSTSTATVTLFNYDPSTPIPDPQEPLIANPDMYFLGDEPQSLTGSVTVNDPEWDVAIVTGHPHVGRLQSFDRSGSFAYSVPDVQEDTNYAYQIFKMPTAAVPYWRATTALVEMPKLDMGIYDGQNGVKMLRERDDVTVGAVTVANMNDTDSDYSRDDQDDVVANNNTPSPTYGTDEVDLMKLVVYRPSVNVLNGGVTVAYVGAADTYFTPASWRALKIAWGRV
jgi:hypothetical protein